MLGIPPTGSVVDVPLVQGVLPAQGRGDAHAGGRDGCCDADGDPHARGCCGDFCGEPVVVDRQLRADATVLAVGAHTVDTRELHEDVLR